MTQEWTEVITIQHYKITKLFHISYLLLLAAKQEVKFTSPVHLTQNVVFASSCRGAWTRKIKMNVLINSRIREAKY